MIPKMLSVAQERDSSLSSGDYRRVLQVGYL